MPVVRPSAEGCTTPSRITQTTQGRVACQESQGSTRPFTPGDFSDPESPLYRCPWLSFVNDPTHPQPHVGLLTVGRERKRKLCAHSLATPCTHARTPSCFPFSSSTSILSLAVFPCPHTHMHGTGLGPSVAFPPLLPPFNQAPYPRKRRCFPPSHGYIYESHF